YEESKTPNSVNGTAKRPRSRPGPICWSQETKALLVGALLERGAENIAQGRPRIRGAVLCDRLLFFGDFERLDRDLHLAGFLVELDHPCIDLFAYSETLGALVGALARKF